jgi:hypothetical protein
MSDQLGFFFDAPLVEMPASQLPPPSVIEPRSLAVRELLALAGPELVACLRQMSSTMPDEIDYDDLLAATGFPSEAITGWHRSRMLEALLPPNGEYQAYQSGPGAVRFKRLYPCPGYEGAECRAMTGGGVLCQRCQMLEEEDLFNQA